MERYICQLKDGNMLYQVNAKLQIVNTGYPYPNTEKSNVEMVKELVESGKDIDNPIEYYYDYVNVITNFCTIMSLLQRDCLVVDLARYYLSNINDNKFADYSIYLIYEDMDKYSILYGSDTVRVVSYDELYRESEISFHSRSNYMQETFLEEVGDSISVQSPLNLGVEQVLELIKIAMSNIDINMIKNIDLTVEEFAKIVINFGGINKNYYFDWDFFAEVISELFKYNRGITISKDDILNLITCMGDVNLVFSDKYFAPILLETKLNSRLGIEYKETNLHALSGTTLDKFIAEYAQYIVYLAKDNKLFEYVDGRFILHIKWKNSHIKDMYYISNSFKSTLSQYVNIQLGMSFAVIPTSVSDTELVWDLHKYLGDSLIALAPLVYSTLEDATGVEYTDVDTLLSGNNVIQMLSGMYNELSDERSMVFKAELFNLCANKLKECVETYYKREMKTVLNKRWVKVYISKIPEDIVNLCGDFNLFARYFCADSELFKFDKSFVQERPGVVVLSYKFRYNFPISRHDTTYNLSISKEMFETQLKWACIIDFVKTILMHVDIDKGAVLPLELGSIYVEFHEESQRIYVKYDYRLIEGRG